MKKTLFILLFFSFSYCKENIKKKMRSSKVSSKNSYKEQKKSLILKSSKKKRINPSKFKIKDLDSKRYSFKIHI